LVSIALILPTAMTYVGVKNLANCPKEPLIPVYLLVGGSFGMLKLVQTIWQQWRLRRKETFEQQSVIEETTVYDPKNTFAITSLNSIESNTFIGLSISIFLFVWFILGNYWVILHFIESILTGQF